MRRKPVRTTLGRAVTLAAASLVAWSVAAAPVAAQTQNTSATPDRMAACQPGEIVIRFSHVVAERGHPKGEAATRLAEEINRELDGRACMVVYPNSELFTDDEVMQALLDGEVELAAPSLSKLEPFTLRFRIFDLPFLFEDYDAVEWFQNSGAGARLLRSLGEDGFKGLGFWNNGMRQMSADRPLLVPGDAAGVTFRIQRSRVIERQFEALDASVLPLSFRDVYPALAEGRVNGQQNTWSNILSKNFYEHQDGVTETSVTMLAYIVVTSEDFWESLPRDVSRDLRSIILRINRDTNRRAREIDRDARAAMVALGVPIRTLTAEQRAAWVDSMQPVWEAFADDIGWDLIQAARAANR